MMIAAPVPTAYQLGLTVDGIIANFEGHGQARH
jgi:hypothetical protein